MLSLLFWGTSGSMLQERVLIPPYTRLPFVMMSMAGQACRQAMHLLKEMIKRSAS
ncbi:hypothetical protein LHK_02489 [Laribacter hongkongensis HLHK9]|uniref:Uncharacterized protein n=1 Tax=Laribacter hongkongensis (strain HLHK9) TaxID=557598 RepID=C1DBR8_LARHH|nr:hypothetical protein LHK_02489 [Laribacter hongkongensis HLHK9]